MKGFEEAFAFVVGVEGGYVNHPSDPGGETKYGISKRAYPHENISALTIKRAKSIYRCDYWNRLQCSLFPYPVAIALFDAAVNQGTTKATKMAQRAAGCISDGIFGPTTIGSIEDMDEHVFVDRFLAERRRHYESLSTFVTFGRGWLKRLDDVEREAWLA